MKRDTATLLYGKEWAELIPVLEVISGGLGPYKDPRLIFDAANAPEFLPDNYSRADIVQARSIIESVNSAVEESDKARFAQELKEVQNDIWKRYNPLQKVDYLLTLADNIPNKVKRISRFDEARSIGIFARETAYKIGVPGIMRPSYEEALLAITGLSENPTPAKSDLDTQRAAINCQLEKLGYTQDYFQDSVAKFRENVTPLRGKEDYITTYRKIAASLIVHIKETDRLFPEEADVTIVTPEAANDGTGGSFDYGRGTGNFQAESYIVPLENGTITDLLITTTHEIGGHFRLTVLWDQYARKTGDYFGHVQTMATNKACTQEGIAEQGIIFYRQFVERYIDPAIVEVELNLHKLNRAVLAYQVARHFSDSPQTEQEIVKQGISYGMLPDAITRRAKGIVNPAREGVLKTYAGPAYHPGLTIFSKAFDQHGGEKIWQKASEPVSISIIHEHLEQS